MEEEGDDKDDTKRRSRNLSEKKRRDQFNMLINELSSMVSSTSRKMDKSTVLRSTINFLKSHNVRSRVHEIQEDWKPAFLTNEEFTHITLEAVDGFIIVFSSNGNIMYVSGSITSLLGHLASDLMNGPMSLYDIVYPGDQAVLNDVLQTCYHGNIGKEHHLQFSVHVRRGELHPDDEHMLTYDLVDFIGYFRGETDTSSVDASDNAVSSTNVFASESESARNCLPRLVFIGAGRLHTTHLISEMTFACDSIRSEFTSRHNLDWKFLALDARATPIIGYVQLEVVGTSGYDYYHVDDLDRIIAGHESLMEKGEGVSCYYRFLTKGQQWVWLQTRYYISYHQWNSKPEFVVCTHRVISYVDVMIQSRKGSDPDDGNDDPSVDSMCPSASNYSLPGSGCEDSRTSTGQVSYASEGSRSGVSSATYSHYGKRSVSSRSRVSSTQNYVLLSPPTSHVTTVPFNPPKTTEGSPLQPVVTLPIEMVASQQLIRSPAPEISDEVKRKQQELLQLRQLMCEKEEELQQFVMAQGMLMNPALPYAVPITSMSTLTPKPTTLTILPPVSSNYAPYNLTSVPSASYQTSPSIQISEGEMLPYQLSQQQAQELLSPSQNLPTNL